MNISPDLMRLLLVLCMLGMALIAALYLRRRALTVIEYLCWGLLILFVPLFGPFLVIYMRPGNLSLQA